ncbi:amylo-alpha-1,6-glucosidase, partial [bacterium]|nr:amylo-alpha-1,6-glucosidase [bacterium]
DEHCDLLGNSLAILGGLATPQRSREIVVWIEARCAGMRTGGELAVDLPPCFFPFTQPGDPDWHPRHEIYNRPGHYHNGGVWPFVCGFYVAALAAAGEQRLAETKLEALTELVRASSRAAGTRPGAFGFNEWCRAQDGEPAGQDWQTWSASMYLYAAACVEQRTGLFF